MSFEINPHPGNTLKITVTNLIDDLGDPVIDAEVSLIVTDPEGTEIANVPADFNSETQAYEGILPAATPLVLGITYTFELLAVAPAGTALWSEKIEMMRRQS